MKQFLKHTVYRLLRPAMRDVLDHLTTLQESTTATARESSYRLAALEARAVAQQQTLGDVHAAAADIARRIARIERRLITSAVWRGGLSGMAVDASGSAVPEMTSKYHAELAFWEGIVRRDAVPTWGMPFEEIYGIWQRVRMTELAEFLDLGQGDAAFEALGPWAQTRRAVEIGSGPYPSIALVRWVHAVAVDPLADGYLTEDLTPKNVHADEVAFIAATGESIPLPARSADLVVLENCLDHVEDPAAVLEECRRLLRPGGLVWLLVDLMEYRDHMHPNPFSEAKIRNLLATKGFEIVRARVNDHKSHPEAYGEFRSLARLAD